jgi:nitrogen-specific signal transduction histidine kinase
LQHPNVRITTQLDASLMHLTGSPADLTKIVMNLVINAIESFKGPGVVTINHRQPLCRWAENRHHRHP